MCFYVDGSDNTGTSFVNNICENAQVGFWQTAASPSFINTFSNNTYYNVAYPGRLAGNYYSTLAAWQTACSCDANSLTSNPLLDGNYKLKQAHPPSAQDSTYQPKHCSTGFRRSRRSASSIRRVGYWRVSVRSIGLPRARLAHVRRRENSAVSRHSG